MIDTVAGAWVAALVGVVQDLTRVVRRNVLLMITIRTLRLPLSFASV